MSAARKPVDVMRVRALIALGDCREHRAREAMRRERPIAFAASQGNSYHPMEALRERQRDLVTIRRALQGAASHG